MEARSHGGRGAKEGKPSFLSSSDANFPRRRRRERRKQSQRPGAGGRDDDDNDNDDVANVYVEDRAKQISCLSRCPANLPSQARPICPNSLNFAPVLLLNPVHEEGRGRRRKDGERSPAH